MPVGAFSQEKAQVWTLSVIVKVRCQVWIPASDQLMISNRQTDGGPPLKHSSIRSFSIIYQTMCNRFFEVWVDGGFRWLGEKSQEGEHWTMWNCKIFGHKSAKYYKNIQGWCLKVFRGNSRCCISGLENQAGGVLSKVQNKNFKNLFINSALM